MSHWCIPMALFLMCALRRTFHTLHQAELTISFYRRNYIEGLHFGNKALLHLTAPHMQILCDIEKQVNNETYHFQEFIRFQELENGTLFGRINPKSAVLPFMADHFENRISGERINPKLQQQLLPLRFRKYRKEFS